MVIEALLAHPAFAGLSERAQSLLFHAALLQCHPGVLGNELAEHLQSPEGRHQKQHFGAHDRAIGYAVAGGGV
jgi:hypothetical protein